MFAHSMLVSSIVCLLKSREEENPASSLAPLRDPSMLVPVNTREETPGNVKAARHGEEVEDCGLVEKAMVGEKIASGTYGAASISKFARKEAAKKKLVGV
jgi:hypothetical protein